MFKLCGFFSVVSRAKLANLMGKLSPARRILIVIVCEDVLRHSQHLVMSRRDIRYEFTHSRVIYQHCAHGACGFCTIDGQYRLMFFNAMAL